MRRKSLIFRLLTFCLLLLSASTYAQVQTVTGQVKDETGAPLPGAVVSVKGSRTAVSTGDNGSFTLKVPAGATLVISHVGFAPKEILATPGTDMSISLTRVAGQLDEIVVTALGVKKSEKALSYAVSTVKGSELTEARTVNIANSLEGKVAGLNISTPATGPGGSSRIVIRGSGSMTGDNQPLIVMDGIPMNNENINNQLGGTTSPGASAVGMWGGTDQGDGISSLNPDEIESITVLKGGTAAALYGSRASNGAILVTTKSGSKASSNVGLDINSNLVGERLLYMHFKDYQYQYGIGDINSMAANPLVGQKPTAADGTPNFQTNSYGAPLDGSQVVQYDNVSRPYVAQKNNLKDFYNTGSTFTNSVAMSGGSDKVTYRLALSDLNNHGTLPDNTLRRDNASANMVGNMSKWFSFVANVKYISEKAHNRPVVSDSPGNADYSMRAIPTSLYVKNLLPAADSNGNERYFNNNVYVNNPYFATSKYQHDDAKQRIITSFEPKLNLTDWLYLKGIVGFDQYQFRNTSIIPTGTAYEPGGGYTRNLLHFNESNLGFILGFEKTVAKDFSISALAGGNAMTQHILVDNTTGSPFNIPFFYDISNIKAANITASDGVADQKINSFYGSIDLSWKNQVFLNVTGRNDWFSALTLPTGVTGKSNNSIFYPSIGASWVISDGFHMPSFVNYLKVRASWAQVGGGTTPYQLANYYSLVGTNNGASLGQIGPSQVPNAHLVPYASLSDEAGIEGRLFNNRMGFDVALYNHNVSKDPVSATVSPGSGYTTAVFNVGKIANRGVEGQISYKIIDGRKFTWEPSLNLAYNKSKIVALYGSLKSITVDEARTQTAYIAQEIGKPYDEIQVSGYARSASNQIMNTATGLPATGALKDMGAGVSPWTLGLTDNFRYKRWNLSFLVDAKFGGKIFDGDEGLAYEYGLAKKTLPGRLTGIAAPGVGPDGKTPNAVVIAAETYYQYLYNFGEPFVYSSDFIKLRSATLDYSFPSTMFGKTPFKSITLSLVGRNLWTIVKHTPVIDPESTYNNGNAQGLEFGAAPLTRSLGLNLNMKF
jgi:TonB-linked SusC/RagA family outer membrane protein